jgi:RimJ/RimL family protein N-acetyltransferase
VELNETRERMGMCGLIKRDTLTYVDLGFAFLRSFWRRGYAFEAATAVLSYGRQALGLRRIVAIVSKDNDRSRTLLERLGFRLESVMKRPNDEELDLYAVAA